MQPGVHGADNQVLFDYEEFIKCYYHSAKANTIILIHICLTLTGAHFP